MASNIDITKPTSGNASTEDVRQNFAAAKDEIEELQNRAPALPTGLEEGMMLRVVGGVLEYVPFPAVNFTGDWSALTTYGQNAVVFYGRTSYYSKEDNNLNNQPDTSPTKWGVVTELAINWKDAWSGAANYVVGDAVSHLGSSYIAIQNNTNQEPPNATYWGVLAAKGDTGPQGPAGSGGGAEVISNGSDTSVSSSTLTTILGPSSTLEANTKYLLTFSGMVSGANGNVRLIFSETLSAVDGWWYSHDLAEPGATGGPENIHFDVDTYNPPNDNIFLGYIPGGSNTARKVLIQVTFTTGATPPTVSVQMNNNGSGTITMRAGSYLRLEQSS